MNDKLGPTVLVDHYRQAAGAASSTTSYRGLPIHALPGLHEFAFEQLRRHCAAGASVLELAAGSGVMSQRLADAGYAVTATDYVPENFRLHASIPFFMSDLNQDFADGREDSLDVVCALEIIEHLENPRHFARQCSRLLKKGGKIVLSTPNVDSAASVVRLMRDGCFQWFAEPDYARDGHITPLTQWQIDKSFSEAGLRFLWRGSFGDPFGLLQGSPRLRLLGKLVHRLMPRDESLKQQIFVAVLQKPLD